MFDSEFDSEFDRKFDKKFDKKFNKKLDNEFAKGLGSKTLGFITGAFQFCKFALIPQPLLPKREKGSRIGSPSPALEEGLKPSAYQKRVRVTKVGCTRSSQAR
ncbi:hypothetical protein HNI00_09045 [Thermoleptolyngbya oregonensis NK1-22]|uniref:Uncharacterized protein n=1 Tax=Thermoleptolyngbya oregonensis NK1-22 TaxID=2547457 RepID=A0AA97BLL2_9CYAN|nr:hypothetical protein [Thermoleptolyngbya oregonensis]WOB43287.1 hypothetical protein HNI00_09045 [Thermoleptolyngbya oregonensis NK1-22]